MKKVLLIVPLITLLFNCSIQKRKYQKGYYVNWDKHQGKTGISVQDCKLAKVKPDSKKSTLPEKVIDLPIESILVSAKNEATFVDLIPKKTVQIKRDENCDDIIFKDGSELKVKVIEITSTDIKYKKCDLPDGPNYVVKKSEIFMVKYANGTREVFKDDNQPIAQVKANAANLKIQPMAVVSIIFGVLGIFPLTIIGSIIAVICGNKALREIRKSPTIYKGEGLAMAGKILGIVILSMLAAYLIVGTILLLLIL